MFITSKYNVSFGVILLCIMIVIVCKKNNTGPENPQTNYTEFTGEYLGQDLPGTTPVRFATDILLANGSWWWHDSPAFSPDKQELYMSHYDTEHTPNVSIDFMRVESDVWTFPQTASFSNEYGEDTPRFSVNGDKLFFTSRRPGGAVFVINRMNDGWSAPAIVDIPGSATLDFTGISVTRDETIYFGMPNSGTNDIYRSRMIDGQYTQPENLGSVINTNSEEWGPYIDPDEDFIIFTSNRPGGFGLHDLYISFHNPDGSWTESQNMGGNINSSNEDASPLISPDERYLFFITARADDQGCNPYWVDAQIVEDFRPINE
jgi:Tol biopolymer transport system component